MLRSLSALRSLAVLTLPVGMALLLAACGGGGSGAGGGGGAPDTTPAVSSGTVGHPIMPLAGTETYTLIYAGTEIGIDARNVTATFNIDNAMNAYNASADEALQLGSNSIAERAGIPGSNIGRWNGGTMAGRYYGYAPVENLTMGGQQGFHYALAYKPNPATLPCSGSSTYTLSAATKPTRGDGSVAPGTVDSASIVVTFTGSTPTFEISAGFSLGGGTSSFAASGMPSYYSLDNNAYYFSDTVDSNARSLYAGFGGAGRQSMVFAFHSYPVPGGGGSAGSVSAAGYLTRTADSSVACPS